MKLVLTLIALVCQHLHAEAIDITQKNFEGRSFGKQSYSYQGDKDIGVITSPQFTQQFTLGKNEKHSFAMKSPSFWVKVSFLNPLGIDKPIYISDTSNFAESLAVYVDGKNVGELYHNDTLLHRVIEVVLPANSTTTLYISRLSYGSQRQSWTYWTDQKKMLNSLRDSERNWSVVIAVLAMSLLFNLMLYFALRLRVYLYYIAYLVTGAAFTTSVWSIIGLSNHRQFTLSMVIITGILAALFSIEFLRLPSNFPLGRKVLLGVIGLWFVPLILLHFKPFVAFRITTLVAVIFASTCIIIAIKVYLTTKATHALIYSIAFGVFMMGIVIQMAIFQGLIPSLASYPHIIMHSGVLGDILLLMAMGYQVHITEKERRNSHTKLSIYASKVQAAQMEYLNSEIRAHSLNEQMKPHFLFNSLNVIDDLIMQSPVEASHAIAKLAEIYRYILMGAKKYLWELSNEITVVTDSLDLQKIRFGDRIDYEIDLDIHKSLDRIYIPSLLLHTIVENSIKHAISKNLNGGKITIKVKALSEGYEILVQDTGPGHFHHFKGNIAGTKTGLENSKKRLLETYGERSNFEVEFAKNGSQVRFWISGRDTSFTFLKRKEQGTNGTKRGNQKF